jgi:hypothetical protein
MQFCKPSKAVGKKTDFVTCGPRLVPHTDTLHQPGEMGKKVEEMTQQIKTFFHTHQGGFMRNETGRGVHDHHSLFKQGSHCWI